MQDETPNEMTSLPLAEPNKVPVEELKLGLEGRVKMIKFGEEFEAWEDSRKINYLKQLASAMNQAAAMMQDERNLLATELQIQRQLVVNAEKALTIQKNIVFSHLTESNEQNNRYIERIQKLEAEARGASTIIRELKERLGEE